MKSISKNNNTEIGFTLIEMLIYIALLSCLMSAFVPYAYTIHEQDLRLLDEIYAAGAS
ncbi:MAG: prepilin-type N-terminal cleavage/methylation domain-containing protein [Candidatus Paceibacterota bacterium]